MFRIDPNWHGRLDLFAHFVLCDRIVEIQSHWGNSPFFFHFLCSGRFLVIIIVFSVSFTSFHDNFIRRCEHWQSSTFCEVRKEDAEKLVRFFSAWSRQMQGRAPDFQTVISTTSYVVRSWLFDMLWALVNPAISHWEFLMSLLSSEKFCLFRTADQNRFKPTPHSHNRVSFSLLWSFSWISIRWRSYKLFSLFLHLRHFGCQNRNVLCALMQKCM